MNYTRNSCLTSNTPKTINKTKCTKYKTTRAVTALRQYTEYNCTLCQEMG